MRGKNGNILLLELVEVEIVLYTRIKAFVVICCTQSLFRKSDHSGKQN